MSQALPWGRLIPNISSLNIIPIVKAVLIAGLDTSKEKSNVAKFVNKGSKILEWASCVLAAL